MKQKTKLNPHQLVAYRSMNPNVFYSFSDGVRDMGKDDRLKLPHERKVNYLKLPSSNIEVDEERLVREIYRFMRKHGKKHTMRYLLRWLSIR